MLDRQLQLPKDKNFFLFGARNTGKTTLIETQFNKNHTFFIDLLDSEQEMRFAKSPNELFQIVKALPESISHVVIDEIQKVPSLLNEVQRLLKDKSRYFIMTGSSARKLKYGGANLLAGRAFVYHLYPLTFIELKDQFNLHAALEWGTLPEVFAYQTEQDKRQFLMSYAHTYLKEEVWGEHLVRKLDPFRQFLEIAAQTNGKIVNHAKIARDVHADDKTIKTYFQILEDTLLGFYLEPYHISIRKRQSEKPKFYLFDIGITRALTHSLSIPLQSSNYAYGEAFEHFLILECVRLNEYYRLDFRFSYIRTPSDVEVDLVIERPGKKTLFIEIKSTKQVTIEMLSSFIQLCKATKNIKAICLSNDPYAKIIDEVTIFPWKLGLEQIFTNPNFDE